MIKHFYLMLLIIYITLTSCGNRNDKYYIENNREDGDLNNTFTEQKVDLELSEEQKFQKNKEKLITEGWQETNIANGQLPNCYNFKPKRGNIDNSLEVYVGSGTDVAIKLMNLQNEKCVRYVFINSGSTYIIRNIPQGKYYLKIAYGKNWLSKIENEQCNGKFIKNPMYEKGEDIMDFNIKHTSNGYSIPSYRLQLDVISTSISNSFNSHNISENDFNN
jgi:hypothetical protein